MRLQVITINGMFPGPLINATTNDVVRVNVFNNVDEPLLITWYIILSPRTNLRYFSANMSVELIQKYMSVELINSYALI